MTNLVQQDRNRGLRRRFVEILHQHPCLICHVMLQRDDHRLKKVSQLKQHSEQLALLFTAVFSGDVEMPYPHLSWLSVRSVHQFMDHTHDTVIIITDENTVQSDLCLTGAFHIYNSKFRSVSLNRRFMNRTEL